MNAKLQELVENLLKGTQAGVLKWTDTAEQGVYRLMLDTGLVRIYRLGPMSVGENFIGCTVLDSKGNVLHDVQAPRREGGPLVTLYDLVDGGFQEGALEELLAEVRMKLQEGGVEQTALHNHLLGELPRVMYMHIAAHGDATTIATAIHDALALTKTPLGAPAGAA